MHLSCTHPVTGELMRLFLKVHKDGLLPILLDKAYEVSIFIIPPFLFISILLIFLSVNGISSSYSY